MKNGVRRSKSCRAKRSNRGVAIITVLTILILMTVLIVSFFAMAATDLQGSRKSAEWLRVLTAKDIAINLVIAQIREATTRDDTAWISQPGAIRLFGKRSNSGRAASIYKLYSSRSMIAGRAAELAADVPDEWHKHPARYVDLNRPVINPDALDPESLARASVHFPIVDPRAFKGIGQSGSVEGFDFDASGVTGIVKGGPDYLKRLPMPVQWLYVLEDGTVGYLDSGNRFVGSVAPSEDNPIVSRVAFWTDDETCKVNVNTASEGVFWDTPRVDTREDRNLASFQPQTGEYQRYPGHPAMTCLSTVLFPNEGRGLGGRLDPRRDIDKFEALWTIAPGIPVEGSRGGTEKVTDIDARPVAAVPENYHLYTSPDEIRFGSDLRGGKRIVHPEITVEKLEHAKFFLTARSRAPETTHHSHPRMLMWPVAERKDRRTVFDRVFAFCGTIGGGEYYFQRESAYSRHNEFYRRAGRRNHHLFDYYRSLTDEPQLGFRGSFADKYGGGRFDDRDNILAESFDYIRDTNLYDSFNRWAYTNGRDDDSSVGHGQIAPICLCGGTAHHPQRWANSRLPLPKGIGRIFGLSEVSVFAIVRAERMSEIESRGSQADITTYDLQPGQKLIQIGLMLEAFAPAHGWTSLQPQMTASFGGGSGNRNDPAPLLTERKRCSFALGRWIQTRRRGEICEDFEQAPKGLDRLGRLRRSEALRRHAFVRANRGRR